MFTANSMNCLTEALGLSLPGNGTLLATHADREQLFLQVWLHPIVDLAKRYYEKDDESCSTALVIAKQTALENAMVLDIVMGGSTNTVLHILAAAHEGEIDFTMADIERVESPPAEYLQGRSFNREGITSKMCIEQVASPAILGELERGGLMDAVGADCSQSYRYVIRLISGTSCATPVLLRPVPYFWSAGPGGIPTQVAFSQDTRWPSPLMRTARKVVFVRLRTRIPPGKVDLPCCSETSPRTVAW